MAIRITGVLQKDVITDKTRNDMLQRMLDGKEYGLKDQGDAAAKLAHSIASKYYFGLMKSDREGCRTFLHNYMSPRLVDEATRWTDMQIASTLMTEVFNTSLFKEADADDPELSEFCEMLTWDEDMIILAEIVD